MKFDFNDYRDHMLYKLCTPLCIAICRLGNVHYIGRENVPKEGGFILACNHISNFDPVALGGAKVRHIHFMAKEELFGNPLLGRFVTALNAFPIKRGSRDETSILYAERLILKGKVLGIFPEGTRRREGRFGRPKSGVAFIARATGADVLPCSVYTKGAFRYGKRMTVRFGRLIKNSEFGFTQDGPHGEVRDAARLVMDEIEKLWEEGHCKK